ncbi:MAG TPA: hypothetical protein GXZ47_03680 [Treponema sp.]|nr:hypothetical protein [Treponema sp.]
MKKICIGFLLAVLLVLMGCQNANTPEDKPSEVKFSGLTANGTAGSVSTTKLTLTFSADPTTLATVILQ